MFWVVGRSWRTQRETCKLHEERPQLGFEPGTLLLCGEVVLNQELDPGAAQEPFMLIKYQKTNKCKCIHC